MTSDYHRAIQTKRHEPTRVDMSKRANEYAVGIVHRRCKTWVCVSRSPATSAAVLLCCFIIIGLGRGIFLEG